MDRGQARDDPGPDGVQGLCGRGEHGADACQGVQIVELPPLEQLLLTVGEGSGPGDDADDRRGPGHAVAVVGEHRHHVRVVRRGGQAGLLRELPHRRRCEVLGSGGLAAGQLPHALGATPEQDPPGGVGDDGEGSGQGVSGGRALLGRRGVGVAGAAQDQECEPVPVQPLGLLPARGEQPDLVLVEGDAALLLGGVPGGRRDDDERAAGPQPLAERVQDAAAVAQERVHQPKGDQVVAVPVQIRGVVAFDVQP